MTSLPVPRTRRGTKLEKPLPLRRNISAEGNLGCTDSTVNSEGIDKVMVLRSFSTGSTALPRFSKNENDKILQMLEKENAPVGRRAARGLKLEKPTSLRTRFSTASESK